MPNGYHGSLKEWDRMEAPLKLIEKDVLQFSRDHSLQYSENYHAWPERSLEWESDGMKKLIQIFLADENTLTFNLWLSAYQDRGSRRYSKDIYLKHSVPISEIQNELSSLLQKAFDEVNTWKSEDLASRP
jgi:hypothetical protein